MRKIEWLENLVSEELRWKLGTYDEKLKRIGDAQCSAERGAVVS